MGKFENQVTLLECCDHISPRAGHNRRGRVTRCNEMENYWKMAIVFQYFGHSVSFANRLQNAISLTVVHA